MIISVGGAEGAGGVDVVVGGGVVGAGLLVPGADVVAGAGEAVQAGMAAIAMTAIMDNTIIPNRLSFVFTWILLTCFWTHCAGCRISSHTLPSPDILPQLAQPQQRFGGCIFIMTGGL